MRYITLTLAIALGCAPLSAADTKATERLGDAADFFSEVMSAPDKAVPQGLLDKAQCLILVPGLKKAAFVFGAKYGRGFAVCRAAGGVASSSLRRSMQEIQADRPGCPLIICSRANKRHI